MIQFLTVVLWIGILVVWISVLWVGIPVDVSDDVASGIVAPTAEEIKDVITNRRLNASGALIPAILIFLLVVYGTWKKNNRLFYIGMSLTIIPILTLAILGLTHESEMPHKNIILVAITFILTLGLLKGLKEIFVGQKMKKRNSHNIT